ncbi:hypothetical protein UB31_36220 [Bradyrhizobium sp. LTSP849]|uniref:hypothetical protein n=1 Tax=Bradyrhizobium sp. LTSP849 TaxID=1615890 RepID=UPI0005D15912|nr:hypothetical protein [Bradyrhizobium sp. LTSP849]KJC36259.1 hypothetical protein UB31_36220 [Bradyrhizobium sp. LTSP849]
MVPVGIFSFLVGAVLAWRFRVWILVPVSLLAAAAAILLGLSHGEGFASTVGQAFLIGALTQLGYGFGLIGRHTLALLRTPSTSRQRTAAVALLYKQRPGH